MFPKPAKESRFIDPSDGLDQQEDHYGIVWVGDLWERATFMRGMESISMDAALKPMFVRALLERLTEHVLETIRALTGKGRFECIALSDDYGTQRGKLMSPQQWRRYVKPCLARVYGSAKNQGLAVFHHSCGSIVPIIGDTIELGLDILHPIQPEAMDIRFLKSESGTHPTFCGGVSTQGLLVSGTPDQVRRGVRRLKREMADGGEYILAPGITIQADVPRGNLIALIDEARQDA